MNLFKIISEIIFYLSDLFWDFGDPSILISEHPQVFVASLGITMMSAGMTLAFWTVTSTVTTKMLLGLITKEKSEEKTPFSSIGYFLIGLGAVTLTIIPFIS